MSTTTKSAAEVLATPVQFLKGVGPPRARLLERLGLRDACDVIFYFPRDYQDLTDVRTIDRLEEGVLVTIVGMVEDVELRNTGTGRSLLGVLVRQENNWLRGIWFNQPFMRDKFFVGQRVVFSGQAKYQGGRWEMVHPKVRFVDDDVEQPSGRVLPVYGLTEGLNQGQMRRVVETAVEMCVGHLDEAFPAEFLQRHDLAPLREALPQIHFPASREALARARRRFVYQELFILQLALGMKREQLRRGARAPALAATAQIDARIRRLFPFELTAGQNEAIAEITADMARNVPMNRLLQGDVGSGKTVVALYAMLLAVAHRYQTVLMAPTEILARQHYETLNRHLAGSRTRIVLLTGGLTPSQRKKAHEQIAAGEVDLIVGTQAVLRSGIELPKVALVVIDEQHKFGVRQRATLKRSAIDPHYLVMTATPIPRTITMSLFGDLDVSTLREPPPGRQKVHTYLASAEQREKWWDFFRRKLREGCQGYVVVPLVDESPQVAAANLEEVYESLANGPLEAFRLGLVHGRLSGTEKQATMSAFARGDVQVLVSTTVVEVGVDVPRATLMTIEGGERFGLSQLHQLRGRVSRGARPGFCCVFADPQTDEAKQRLDAFVNSTDGFELAEIDLKIRGPGDLLGTRQHGAPPLLIADLQADIAVLEEARAAALELVAEDPVLSRAEHARLRKQVHNRYGAVLDLGDVA